MKQETFFNIFMKYALDFAIRHILRYISLRHRRFTARGNEACVKVFSEVIKFKEGHHISYNGLMEIKQCFCFCPLPSFMGYFPISSIGWITQESACSTLLSLSLDVLC